MEANMETGPETYFDSLFETDPQVRHVFCPPKELYEGGHPVTVRRQ